MNGADVLSLFSLCGMASVALYNLLHKTCKSGSLLWIIRSISICADNGHLGGEMGDDPELVVQRRRAYYRASHRGTQEMDLLLGRFAAARLPGMDGAQLALFERLMDQPDPELQRRLMAPASGERADDSAARGPVQDMIQAIRVFHGLAGHGLAGKGSSGKGSSGKGSSGKGSSGQDSSGNGLAGNGQSHKGGRRERKT